MKPHNLLVTVDVETGKLIIKVADFGLARMPNTKSSQMTYSPGGTPGYMAPELIKGDSFKASCDMYSLGVVALELLTGNRELGALHLTKAPAKLIQLVTNLLAPNPESRPNTQQVAAVLKGVLQAKKPQKNSKTPSPPKASSPPQGGDDTGLILLLGGGLLLGLAALANGGGKNWDENVQRYRGRDGTFRR